jgi:CBS domain-containing protein
MSNDKPIDKQILEDRIRKAKNEACGVINMGFLMQSIGGLSKNLPVCVATDSITKSVVQTMIEKKVGSVLLLDKDDKVVGIFTERDYLKQFALGQKDPNVVKISEVATLDLITCHPETTIAYALNLMSHGGFRHLPIVDEAGRAIGVVSVRDVLDRISELLVQDLMAFDSF